MPTDLKVSTVPSALIAPSGVVLGAVVKVKPDAEGLIIRVRGAPPAPVDVGQMTQVRVDRVAPKVPAVEARKVLVVEDLVVRHPACL